MTVQDDINAIVTTDASIYNTRAAATPLLNALIAVANALPNSGVRAKVTTALTPFVLQYNKLAPFVNDLHGEVPRLVSNYFASLPPTQSPVPVPTPAPIPSSGFHVLPIGGGGFLTGMSQSSDGTTKLVRTDTHGAYRLNSADQWQQINTQTSLAGYSDSPLSGGVYEICVAPSAPNIAYMMFWGRMFKSTNINTDTPIWTHLKSFAPVNVDWNGTFRYAGRKMAVDPTNPDKVYVGTDSNGVWVTSDGGLSFARLSDIPISASVNGAYPGHQIVFVDSNTIYIGSYGSQIRKSVNAGATWTATSGGPSKTINLKAGSTGVLSAIEYDATQSLTNNEWRYNGSWLQLSVGMNGWASAIDPNDPEHVIIQHPAGAVAITTNFISGNPPKWDVQVFGWTVNRVTSDVPWMALSGSAATAWFTADLQFDPVIPGSLWMPEGLGVWNGSISGTTVTWTSHTAGIEQLVSQEIVHPPGGKPIYVCQDRGVFRLPSLTTSPPGNWDSSVFAAGYSFDYAMDDPSFGVAVIWGGGGNPYHNSKTSDGGITWSPITDPSNGTAIAGCIAVSTANNWLLAPSNNPKDLYYTKDGGKTWKTVAITTIQNTDGLWGWQWSMYVRSRMVDADRNTPNVFRLYDFNPADKGGGVYASRDGGDTCVRIWSGILPTTGGSSFGILKSVPGVPGQLMWCAGGGSESTEFLILTDDGLQTPTSLTRTVVPSISTVSRFGFGKSSQTYPTIFASTIGKSAAGPAGLYRSDDYCKSWTLMAEHPLDSTDQILALDGDKDVQGMVYGGFGGSGPFYGS